MGLKFFDAFAGVGGFRLGMERAGHTCVGGAEIDKWARAIYEHRFGDSTTHFGDITKVDPADIPDFDVLCGGFPCFPAGTMVVTDSGERPIESVLPGDTVYTHAGSYRRVIHSMVKPYGGNFVRLRLAMGVASITATPEHPFYIVKRSRRYNSRKRCYDVMFSAAEWTAAKDVVPGDTFAVFKINDEAVVPEFRFRKMVNKTHSIEDSIDTSSPNLWYLAGKYLANGWRRTQPRTRSKGSAPSNCYRTVIACDASDPAGIGRVVSAAKTMASPCVVREGQVYKVHIENQGLWMMLEAFGSGTHGKRIPEYVQRLPRDLAAEFLCGYIDGNGSSFAAGRAVSITTVSAQLARDVQRLVMKVHGVVPSVRLCRMPKTTTICGRTVTQSDFYTVRFYVEKKRDRNSFVRNGHAYIRIVGREEVGAARDVLVYNLEVDGDNSYCVGPVAVHNCQAFSVAGRRGGFSDTRGTLFFEIARIAAAKAPRLLLLENVKGLLSHDKGWTFWTILRTLDELGYDASWQVLNSRHFGVPQNRERVFIVARSRASRGREVFPISESDVWNSCTHDAAQGEGERLQGESGQVAGTVSTGGGGRQLVELTDLGTADAQNVYDPNGVAKTIKSGGGGQGAKTGPYLVRKNLNAKTRKQKKFFERDQDFSPTIMSKEDYNPKVLYKQGFSDDAVMKEGDLTPPLKASDAKRGDTPPMIIHRNQRGESRLKDESGAVQSTMHGNNTSKVFEDVARIRRLTPIECERLQGFPEVEEIQCFVCENYLGRQLGHANAEVPCLKSPKSALHVYGAKSCPAAWPTADPSSTSLLGPGRPVDLLVHIDFVRQALRVLSREKCLLSASIAARLGSSVQLMSQENTALDLVSMLTDAAHFISLGSLGRVVSRLSTMPSTRHRSTTSVAGRNSQISGWSSGTLPSSVMDAIAGFIPGRISSGGSFSFAVAVREGWTAQGVLHAKSGHGINLISDTQRYKCIGNAVTVNVIEAIAKRLE